MTKNAVKKILVTFLGTANYAETCYQLNEGEHRTRYTSVAIANLCEVSHVEVLATEEAKEKHGDELKKELDAQGIDCKLIPIPSGSTEKEQWNLFIIMHQTMKRNDVQVVVDITSGFRVQPFFVSSVISMLRATEQGCHDLQLLYGEYHRDKVISPIWDLTLFIELQDWVQALTVFLKTGHADGLNALSSTQDINLRKEHFKSGGKLASKPKTEKLVNALRVFADDLNTVRVAAMLIGYHDDKNVISSSQRVLDAIEECREDIQRLMPPLGGILGDLKTMLLPLPTTTLSGTEGHASLLALAKLYQGFGRYAEAATVVREGYI
ncbi:MAG: TM1812 family CRISPR-associated protein, partial [Mariprofundaceae bacterium]|nr:TM1812 family CRISPR-associated protein [Mariprofundaceae bacterium]